jgi:hypothetical protein
MSNLEEQRKAYDALPLLDSEYNHPVVQNAVLNLIEAEMKAFAPPKDNYLSSLPYPKLRFSNAPGFAQEYEKINKETRGNTEGDFKMQKLMDTTRYSVTAPSGSSEQDPQAWSNAIANVKAQYENQKNRLMNLELELEYGADTMKQYSAALEGSVRHTEKIAENSQKMKNTINSRRIHNQKIAAPQLGRVTGKRNETLIRILNLNAAIQSKKQRNE